LLSFDLKVVENAAAALDEPAAVVDVTFVAVAEDALVELVDVAEDVLEERLAVDEEDETAEAKNLGAAVETDDVVAADVEVVKAVEAAELEIVLHDIAEDERVGVAVV
jgi:predicted  nucleic acid-binding Zn-ribbon protein